MTPAGELLGCSCPLGSQQDCFHRRFFRKFEVRKLGYLQDSGSSGMNYSIFHSLSRRLHRVDTPQIFLRRHLDNGCFVTMVSVPSTGTSRLKGRAIVTHNGANFQSGSWHCSKDQARSCQHIVTAMKTVVESLGDNDADIGDYLPAALEDIASGDTGEFWAILLCKT